MPRKQGEPTPVSIEHEGETYHGTYTIEKGLITVSSSGLKPTTTHVGNRPVDWLTEMLLAEMVHQSKM